LSTPSRLAGVDALAASTGFAGVVRVDLGGETVFARAYGLACRAHGIPNRVDTRFGIASGTKGLTALAVLSLIEDGALRLISPVADPPKALRLGSVRLEESYRAKRVDLRNLFGTE